MINYPHYDRNQRRKTFERLPKGAYVLMIKGAEPYKWPSGDEAIKVYFDIAEGEYMGFYQKQYDARSGEDKRWPFDAVYTLGVPTDQSPDYVWTNYNSFFADLEDSNDGYVFTGDLKTLRGRLIGGLFRIRQTEKDGNVYDHTELKWTATVEDVRSESYGRLPYDKLIEAKPSQRPDSDGFMSIPDGADDKLPF